MSKQKNTIGVIGGNVVGEEDRIQAYEVGKQIALKNAVLVCGGLGGTMEAAARGAFENGGVVVGILPGDQKSDANQYITIALPTGMGVARNILVIRAADVIVAFPGSYGTLSEIAIALTLGKTVVYMPGSWNLTKIGKIDTSLFKEAFDAQQAIGLALSSIIR